MNHRRLSRLDYKTIIVTFHTAKVASHNVTFTERRTTIYVKGSMDLLAFFDPESLSNVACKVGLGESLWDVYSISNDFCDVWAECAMCAE